MFMIAGSNHGDAETNKTIVFYTDGYGYEIGIGEPARQRTEIRFIWEYSLNDHNKYTNGTLYKYPSMTVEDVAELILDRIGQGTKVTNMVNLNEEAMLDKFHLALRDYIVHQIDGKMGLNKLSEDK